MADRVRKADYCYLTVSSRAGQGAKVLAALQDAQVNLQAFSAFPVAGGKAQIDLVAKDLAPIRQVAKQHKWKLSRPKKAFLIQGRNRVGAVEQHLERLAEAKINVTAADAVTAGVGRYGMILWVKAKDHAKAARVLGAR
jgi:hypothetical protein